MSIFITDLKVGSATEHAQQLLNVFSSFPPYYPHGSDDPHLRWLRSLTYLPLGQVIRFFNAWRPLSRHQPQLLLLMASVFDDPLIQKRIVKGNAEEEGGWNEGHDPHWVLLDHLIKKLGGTPVVVGRSEEIMNRFQEGLRRPMSEAAAAGILAGIENPALDISAYFQEIVRCSGFRHLIDEDLYLSIHVKVEPGHIVDSHELALQYMREGREERAEVLSAFADVMNFWSGFWTAAFNDLTETQRAS